jgi:recombination protein RecT
MSTSIQKPAAPQTDTLKQEIEARLTSGAFKSVSTQYLTPERMVKLALVMISKTPDLRKASVLKVVSELMTCARLGLEPGVEGGRWLLPFKNNKTGEMDVVGVTDYRGLVDIARRSGEVLAIHADIRKANDLWENWIDAGGATLVHLRHRRAETDRGLTVGVYAVVKLKNGEVQAIYLTKDEVDATRSRSRGAKSEYSPWSTDWDSMAKKTAIRRLYNLLPKTPEITAAREVLAEEDAEDRETDVTPSSTPITAASLKDKLRAKAAAPPDRTLEPGVDPTSMADQPPGDFHEPGEEG